jgi:hypothetical protein
LRRNQTGKTMKSLEKKKKRKKDDADDEIEVDVQCF